MDNVEILEDILLLCPPPDADNEIVAYFSTIMKYPNVSGVDITDHGDKFVAVYGKRIAEGKTPAEAIKNCLLLTDLLG